MSCFSSYLFSNHNQEGTCHTIQHRKHPPGERISDAFNRNQVAQREMVLFTDGKFLCHITGASAFLKQITTHL